MNSYSRRYRLPCNGTTFANNGPGTILSKPRLPLRSYMKPKNSFNTASLEATPFSRLKRFKSRKINGCQKIDAAKKKTPDYTETAYRDAVSKLKYLLAESYAPRLLTGKMPRDRALYRRSNLRINETPEDSDERSISDCSRRTKTFVGNQFEDGNACEAPEKNRRLVTASQNSVLFPAREPRSSSPSELTSFIARQEEYIEQLEQESRYCKEELKNLLEKIREVVAENEALHDKNKSGLLKSFLREYESCDENKKLEKTNQAISDVSNKTGKETKVVHLPLEGPNIVFESRISELEAQLTQARIELKKAREDNDTSVKRLAESCGNQTSSEFATQHEQVLREKRELGEKLDEALRNLQSARERENEVTQRAKRATELAQQSDFDKYQADSEIRRLNDELDRQREKLREAAQETSRRVAEERHQVERRYSQQVDQLSADVASHWDAASKSQMETEKQRRELAELKRDLSQKQVMIDDLKKELQNKISNLQSDLNQAIAEKDAADQEIAAAKIAAERNERQSRQEQSRWQAEINSYKQRLERADADIVHCRRENLRLSEQIASLEKELNMNKLIHPPETQAQGMTPRPEGEKDLTAMIMDVETKHEKPVEEDDGGRINLTTTPSKKKRTVKVDLKVKVTPKKKSVSSKSVKMPLSAQEEMASLQNNLEYLSSKINDTLENKKGGQTLVSDRKNAQHNDESDATKTQNSVPNEYPIAEVDDQSYARDYNENPNVQQFEDENAEYARQRENVDQTDTQITRENDPQNYVLQDEQKYQEQEYPVDNSNYPTEYGNQEYDQYGQYDPSLYQSNPNAEETGEHASAENVLYQQDQQQYEDYPIANYAEDPHQQIPPDDQQEYTKPTTPAEPNLSET